MFYSVIGEIISQIGIPQTRSRLFPVDPFAERPIVINDQVDANYSEELNSIPPVITDGFGANQRAVQPLVQGPQAAARETEVYENTALFPGEDPNANYLNILFNPPVLPHLSSSDLMYDANSLGHNGGEIFDVHTNTFVENVSRSDSRNADCALKRINTSWPARAESPTRPRLWQDVAFGSMDNIFSSPAFDMMVEPASQTPESDNGTEIDLNYDIKRRLRDLKRNISEEAMDFIKKTYPAAQGYGFFCSRLGQSFESLYPPLLDEEGRWKAWSRVEATKNLIIGLLLHDSWLSGLFSSSPIISANSIYLALPSEDLLYRAPSAEKWMQLVAQGSSTLTPTLELSFYGFHLPDVPCPVHAFSMYGLLCSILLRVSADCHRLVSSSDLFSPEQHNSIPWNICRIDKRGSIAGRLLMQTIQSYDQTFRESNPNCIVIWHSVCILLTIDINVLERGAGRHGLEAMHEARRALARWAQTPSARRSCLHAAQIFRTLSHRNPADGTAFQSVRALFMSALVLGLYILMGPTYERTGESGVFDLADAEVDWKEVGDEGISISGLPDPSHTSSQNAEENPAVYFIRHGGPILFSGKTYRPGARHAQRMILDFAGLLDEVGTHWMADYARLLYMVNDTMGNPGT
ncbi:hypothetical protein N7474_002832 [Penicillium riverlandense]|uniref:uncharacterized protein n=1 Tax=Penicillium riverlandense TaxID=1903569 RepID=UPI002546F020|nr:uncharacterized protein N7474_002832 [Penicillium riverlandense]KAJ5825694.1 hypothetical protein N7474_002832 [Penicillium riverlandense]